MIDVTLPPFNASGDGVADDSASIQAALQDADNNVLFPEGRAFLCNNLLIPSGKRLHMHGATLLTRSNAPAPFGRVWTFATAVGARDIALIGGRLVGERVGTIPPGGFFIGFRGDGLIEGLLDGVKMVDHTWDGAHFGGNTPCRKITIQNCTFMGAGRNNLSIVRAEDVLVVNSMFLGTTGDNPGAGIDIEQNAHPSAEQRIDNVVVIRCTFDNCSVGIYDHAVAQNAFSRKHRIIDNVIMNSRRMSIVANEIDNLIIAGNDVEGQPVFAGPPTFLTIGISVGAGKEAERTTTFTIKTNKVRRHSRDVVLAGVLTGEVVDNDVRQIEKAGLGEKGDVLEARNFIR